MADRRVRRHRVMRPALGILVLALATSATLGLPTHTSAHAELIESTPPANAALLESPSELSLRFTEAIDPVTAHVELTDAGELIGGLGAPAVDATGATVTASLPALEPALYTVSYQVVSAVDGHATAGTFAFLVDPTGTQPPPTGAPSSVAPAVGAPAVIARWIALLAALATFGTLLFWVRSGPRLPLADPTAPWLLVAGASLIGLVGLATYLALAARPIDPAVGGHGAHGAPTGFILDLAAPFGWTPFAIAMRVALLASLLGFVMSIGRHLRISALRRHGREPSTDADRRLGGIGLALAAVALLGMSLAGHAASLGGPAFGLLDWVHLLAVGAWLGPIPAIAIVWRRARASGVPPRSAAGAALRDHSRLALAAAPIVALTGIANSPIVLGASRELVASAYGSLLLAKAVLFSVAVAIGAANHFLVRAGAVRRVAPLLAAELAIAVLAVSVAATMVTVQPAAVRQPTLSSAAIGAAHLYGTVGRSSLHLAVNLPAPGNQRYQVVVADAETGRPPDDVEEVSLNFIPPADSGLPATRVDLVPQEGPGLYGAAGMYTPVIGDWSVEVTIRRQGAGDESLTFGLPVSEPLPQRRVPPPDTGVGVPAPLAALWAFLPAPLGGWLPTLLLLGGAAGLTAATDIRRRSAARVLGVTRTGLLVLAVVAGLAAGSRALVQAANTVPAEAAAVTSPITADDASLARGRNVFLANCAACHGPDGAGDGPSAIGMLPAPADLALVVPRMTDGGLAYRVTNGLAGTPMPAFAATLSENDTWDLVNYMRSRWGADR
jgi:copper transport protein